MTRQDKVKHKIAIVLQVLGNLSDNLAKEPDQWHAINEAEVAMHKVRKTFEQEIPE